MEPGIDFATAEREWARTMLDLANVTTMEWDDALNKQGKSVIIEAIKRTPRADPAAIRASLEADGLKYRLIKKIGLNRREIERKAKRFVSKSASSARYVVAGFYNGLAALGGRAGRTRSGGRAEQSTGTKATPGNLRIVFINKTVGAVEVAGKALAGAFDFRRGDMMIYIQRKLRERWERR